MLKSIDCSKATGSDGVPGSVLKACSDLLAPSLTALFNCSITSGVFPEKMKLAHISPLYKGGDSTQAKNYRPVALLSIISKLLERIVYEQLNSYLQLWDILPDQQYAYRKQRSTEDALTVAIDRLYAARDDKKYSASVFIDLSKAFDKVQHKTLIRILYSIGITGAPLQWFISYVSNRVQIVKVGSDESNPELVTCGVPQGSVLGPMLFSLYVKDVMDALAQFDVQVLQFADDIMLFGSGMSLDILSAELSGAVTAVAEWLQDRGLMLNAKKSQVMIVSPSGHQEQSPEVAIKCRGQSLPQVASAKYLGLTITNDLSWTVHISNVANKAAGKIGALARSKNNLTISARKQFYSAVIRTDLLYASNAFSGNLSSANTDRLLKLQKKGLRAIYGLPPWAHSAPLFTQLTETVINVQMFKKLAYLVWRCVNKFCSRELSDLFSTRHNPAAATRGHASNALVLPLANSAAGLKRPSFTAALLWNSQPSLVRTAATRADFFSKLAVQHLRI